MQRICTLSWKLRSLIITGLGLALPLWRAVGERWAHSMIGGVGKLSRPKSCGISWDIKPVISLDYNAGFDSPNRQVDVIFLQLLNPSNTHTLSSLAPTRCSNKLTWSPKVLKEFWMLLKLLWMESDFSSKWISMSVLICWMASHKVYIVICCSSIMTNSRKTCGCKQTIIC